MIHNGTHHVTNRPRVIAECDHDGCLESLYMAEEMGTYTAGETMRRLGWDVGNHRPGQDGAIHALCPEHARSTAQCVHSVTIRLDDGVRVCQFCGRTPGLEAA